MRTRLWMTMALAIGALVACDDGPDTPAPGDEADAARRPMPPALPPIAVAGACPVDDDLGRIALSVLLADDRQTLAPDDVIDGERLDARLDAADFTFRQVSPDDGEGLDGHGVATGPDGARMGVSLMPEALEFVPAGGVGRDAEPRLVVMMLDHSGSLVGVDPFTGRFDPVRASDPDDHRIGFFSSLVARIVDDAFVSLVSFSGLFPVISPEYSTPTRNGARMQDGLWALQFEEWGETPLVRALDATRSRVIEPNAGMNPVVVLFTDGVEHGDPTDADGAFEEMVAGYAGDAMRPSIPIIVLHLQPASGDMSGRGGRDARLAELACRTGGDYIFVPRAEALTGDPSLLDTVVRRLDGAWRLTVATTLSDPAFAPGGWLLSARLDAMIVGRRVGVDLTEAMGAGGTPNDSRLWLDKRR